MEENCVGEVREPPERYDLLTAVMVCLGGPEDGNYEGLLRLLGVLLSADMRADQKQEILERGRSLPKRQGDVLRFLRTVMYLNQEIFFKPTIAYLAVAGWVFYFVVILHADENYRSTNFYFCQHSGFRSYLLQIFMACSIATPDNPRTLFYTRCHTELQQNCWRRRV